MTIAKGLTSGYIPMGGLIVRDEVVEVLNEGGDFNHGFTYSGHPVAAAVALENIRILRDEKIIEQVKSETAPYLQKRLRELTDHPLVGEVRGVGHVGRHRAGAGQGHAQALRRQGRRHDLPRASASTTA